MCTKLYFQNSALIIVIGFYYSYHDISSVFITNKTVSVTRKLQWSTIQASQHTRGAGRNRTLGADPDKKRAASRAHYIADPD